MENISIVGLGRLGTALAGILDSFGFRIKVVTHDQRDKTKCINSKLFPVLSLIKAAEESEIIFITTPDGVIADIVEQMKDLDLDGKAILHLSGSLSSGILAPLKNKGAVVGSLHPLQSFASVEQAVLNLPGAYFTYEGDDSLLNWVSSLVNKLGGTLQILSSAESKVIYHTGAVIVSNYLVALAQLGVKCLEHSGFTAEQAREALLPLMRGTLNNISRLPLGQALTGPISRGDIDVVKSHIEALTRELPEVKSPYCILAPVLADIARESGKLSIEKYHELMRILQGGVSCGKNNS